MKAMLKKEVSILSVVFFLILSAANAGETGPVRLRLEAVDPADEVQVGITQVLTEALGETTGGVVSVEVVQAQTARSGGETYEALKTGLLDIALLDGVYLERDIPEMAVLNQPFFFNAEYQAARVYSDAAMSLISDKARLQGVHILAWLEAGERNILSRKSISAVDDFLGLRMAIPEAKSLTLTFAALRAATAPFTTADPGKAFRDGSVDTIEIGDPMVKIDMEAEGNGLYLNRTRHRFAYVALCMSNRAWTNIPQELQQRFLDGMKRGGDGAAVILQNHSQQLFSTGVGETVDFNAAGIDDALIDSRRVLSIGVPPALQNAIEKAVAPFDAQ